MRVYDFIELCTDVSIENVRIFNSCYTGEFHYEYEGTADGIPTSLLDCEIDSWDLGNINGESCICLNISIED